MDIRLEDTDMIKSFFNYYKRFVDVALVRKDVDTYHGKLLYVSELVKNIDFDKNLLFICNRDIMKEVFLSGFLTLDRWRSNDLINIGQFLDIHMGSRRSDRADLRPSDMTYEDEYDILHDVLCVSCNYYEVKFSNNKLNEDVLINTIMHRYDTIEKDPKKPLKVTWIFAFGSSSLVTREYNTLVSFFKSKENHPLFDIIDLNILDKDYKEDEVKEADTTKVSSNSGDVSSNENTNTTTKKKTSKKKEKDLEVQMGKKGIPKDFTVDVKG